MPNEYEVNEQYMLYSVDAVIGYYINIEATQKIETSQTN